MRSPRAPPAPPRNKCHPRAGGEGGLGGPAVVRGSGLRLGWLLSCGPGVKPRPPRSFWLLSERGTEGWRGLWLPAQGLRAPRGPSPLAVPHFFLEPICVALNEHSWSVISSTLAWLVPVAGPSAIFYTAKTGISLESEHLVLSTQDK